ncbi:winged helix-turn-helix domain-containing protein [Nonomuraea roseola]|uniref:Winged helix-turn-helix domain-containing protein n=1 Tax=Nonomuraea roseola TaxID=46179 RepID=A0ABV5PY30_9ACTN
MAEEQGIPPFDPEGAVYVYAAMADHIAARIQAGELRVNARLAGERALAEEYGVALGTARRAIEELRQRGLVVTLPAKGTFVAAPQPGGDGETEPV